jgi:hypothetical protein
MTGGTHEALHGLVNHPRIDEKENTGLFSSSGDQQEQPFAQVNADRSIWIKWQRLAAIGTGWREMLMSS